MLLPISTVGVDSGLSWEQNLNAALTLIDQHTHAPGSGALISPSSLDINSSFPLNNNDLVTVRSVRFQLQTPPLPATTPDLGCIYISSGNLYYNNTSGDQVPITNGASLAGASGTISGLPSGTASASFAAGTFVFQSATNTGATIDGRNFILRNNTVSSKGLTLTPPSAMAADYNLILPALPASTSFLQLDASGNITSGPAISLGITGSNIASATITTDKIALLTITGANMANGTVTNVQIGTETIIANNIANVTIPGGKLINGTITGTQIATDVDLNGKSPTVSSKKIVVSNTNNTNQLAIVRAGFSATPSTVTIVNGEGASGSYVGTGHYQITWDSPFLDTPTVTVTAISPSGTVIPINLGTVDSTAAIIWFDNQSTDGIFDLIAIGQRS